MSYQPPFDANWMIARPSPVTWYMPRSVQNAVRFMYAGALVAAITPAVTLVTIGDLNRAIAQQLPTSLTASQLATADLRDVGSVVVGGLIDIGLWLWMARKNRAGRRWARILATIFFAVNSLGSFALATVPVSGLTKAVEALGWIVGLCAIVLLWHRDSTVFFSAQARPY